MAETAAPPRPAGSLDRGPGYEEDFVVWTERQAALIRAGRFDLVDWENVAEEIDSSGSGNRRQLGNRLDVLIRHLLKWQFQPAARSGSWRGSIRTQRGRILRLLKQSPSLRQHVRAKPRMATPEPPLRLPMTPACLRTSCLRPALTRRKSCSAKRSSLAR